MKTDQTLRDRLYGRIRRAPSQSSVTNSLPVLFFGDLFSARIATLGLNPSNREFVDKNGRELTGEKRRFETLSSLEAEDRLDLSDAQCERAICTMRGYFGMGKQVYNWFAGLDRVTKGMGLCYQLGEVAHLDLVQEATSPTWSRLKKGKPTEATMMLQLDLPFLQWQLETYSITALICNGKTPSEQILNLLRADRLESGKMSRVTWFIAAATVAGRKMAIAGWNIPLAKPTGLGKNGEKRLGRTLAVKMNDIGFRGIRGTPRV